MNNNFDPLQEAVNSFFAKPKLFAIGTEEKVKRVYFVEAASAAQAMIAVQLNKDTMVSGAQLTGETIVNYTEVPNKAEMLELIRLTEYQDMAKEDFYAGVDLDDEKLEEFINK